MSSATLINPFMLTPVVPQFLPELQPVLLLDITGDDHVADPAPLDPFTVFLLDVTPSDDTAINLITGNVLASASAVASSDQGGYEGYRAIDGSTATWWNAVGYVPQWLVCDLGFGNAGIPVDVRIYGKAAGWDPADFTYAGSNDGVAFTTLTTVTGASWGGESWQTFSFSNTTSYRYFKLTITNNVSNSFYPAIFGLTSYSA